MKKLQFILPLILVLLSCKKEDKYPQMQVFGHAGDGIDISSAPYQENTYEAVKYALGYNEISGVELDLQWSKDGTIWLYHDDDLSVQTNTSGEINQKTDSELTDVKYKGLNSEKLTKLVDIIPLADGKELILDIKFVNGVNLSLSEIQESFSDIVPLTSNIQISVILQTMDYQPYFQSLGWKVYMNTESVTDYFTIQNWEQTNGCCVSNSNITSNDVQNVKNADKKVIIFSARAPKTIRKALKKQPDIFLADDIRATLIEKIR